MELEIKLFRYVTEDRFAIFKYVSGELSDSIFSKKTLLNQEPVVFENRDR